MASILPARGAVGKAAAFGGQCLYDTAELLASTWRDLPVGLFALLAIAWQPVVVFAHELGHGAAALSLTRGSVEVHVGREPHLVQVSIGRCQLGISPGLTSSGGHCQYEPGQLWRGRHEAYIALAGPFASMALAAVLSAAALILARSSPTAAHVLVAGAAGSACTSVLSALPLRYAPGSGAAGLECDGMVAWRVLTGSTRRAPSLTYGRYPKHEPFIRPLFTGLFAFAAIAALIVGPGLGLMFFAVFGLGALLQAFEERRESG